MNCLLPVSIENESIKKLSWGGFFESNNFKKLEFGSVWMWADLGSKSREESIFYWLARHSPFGKHQGIEMMEKGLG